jgi:uncharacterized RDD family membrane protein YckC
VSELVGSVSSKRVLAGGLDSICAALLGMAAGRMLGVVNPYFGWAAAAALFVAYFAVSESAFGASPWKAVFGLRVVSLTGERVRPAAVWLRSALRLLEANPVLLGLFPGGFVVAATSRRQRVGDLLAGTLVVERSSLERIAAQANNQTQQTGAKTQAAD